MKISDDRREAFLEALAASGSFSAAARHASPHLDSPRAGESSFRNLVKIDPTFAAEAAAAEAVYLGRLEEEMAKRALSPDMPGSMTALCKSIERLDSSWLQRTAKDITISGTLNHSANPQNPGGVLLSADDVLALPPERRALLVELLEEVETQRALPAEIDVIE